MLSTILINPAERFFNIIPAYLVGQFILHGA